jgi:hypothetical protein
MAALARAAPVLLHLCCALGRIMLHFMLQHKRSIKCSIVLVHSSKPLLAMQILQLRVPRQTFIAVAILLRCTI